MKFKEFNALLMAHVTEMSTDEQYLFEVDLDPNELWDAYLDSYPPGTNEIFRERREHDCSCCRHFIRSFGNVVAIKNNKMVSIWDFKTGDSTFQTVIDALNVLVTSKQIRNVFLPEGRGFGTKSSTEILDSGDSQVWNHFYVKTTDSIKTFKEDRIGSVRGDMGSSKHVLHRSLTEISSDAIETVLELTAQNSLYKGEEWKQVLSIFQSLHSEYQLLPEEQRDNFCWKASAGTRGAVSRIKNHSIGTLLTDLSEGRDLNDAVKSYEAIVAPSNYKRPKAIYSKKMLEVARNTVEELGLSDSLGRRFATLEDITVNNILFANKDTLKKMSGNVFEEMAETLPDNIQSFDKVEEIAVDKFVANILPEASEIEVYLENGHSGNMVSLIAPKTESKSMFKWNNGFSWAYKGNIADSMKERVKRAGGDVEGVLRFSIQWNDDDDNHDDLDAHCIEPNGNHIHYPLARRVQASTGVLDVDIVQPNGVAVENITWSDRLRMYNGTYHFKVHNFSSRGARSGFTAEIEFDGKVFEFSYPEPLRNRQYIDVAEVTLKDGVFTLEEILPSGSQTKNIWGLTTGKFHPVSACMYSPNYWDGQSGIGHKHYFFLVKDCINDESPNGFFNEFLKEDLMPHKRVFEALGSKMKVENSENQLSGLGFSSTKRAAVVCKVKGSFTRLLKVLF